MQVLVRVMPQQYQQGYAVARATQVDAAFPFLRFMRLPGADYSLILRAFLCTASLLKERRKIPQKVSQARRARVEEAAALLPCLQLSLLCFDSWLETGTAECWMLSCDVYNVRAVYKKT